MKKSLGFILGAVFLLTAAAGCTPANATPAATTAEGNQRTIYTNGTGTVTITPDIAYITIGVHTQAEDIGTALANNTSQAQAVSDALQGLGVDPKDIQTTAFNVYPQQQYGANGEMLGLVYVVDNSVYITVRDLTRMGEILSAVVKSGANNISGIQFDVANRTQAESEARKKAVEDARQQAEELATAAGEKLGPIISLSASPSGTAPTYYSLKNDAAGVGGNVPVSAGQLVITVTASATYELQ